MPHDIYTVPPSQNKVEPSMDNIQSFFLERGENITARMISDSFTGISRPAAEEIVFRIKSAGGIMGFKDYMQDVYKRQACMWSYTNSSATSFITASNICSWLVIAFISARYKPCLLYTSILCIYV